MPGLHEELCNSDGNVDKGKVLTFCPSWEQAINVGMPCIVFKRELETACPELPAFLSKAGNQSHEVHSKETKVQLMLAIMQLYVSHKRLRPNEPVSDKTWDRAVEEVISMKPHFKDRSGFKIQCIS